jgi:hypothetical protein
LPGGSYVGPCSRWPSPGASQSALADAPRLGPFERPKPRELTIFRDDQAFNPFEALNGSYASAASCATVPHGLWIEIDGKGDCIRYYPQALAEGENRTVLVYFGGDVMLRNSKGVRFITDSYLRQSPATIAAEMADWARQAGRPAIFMARPGIYGSSGYHNKRRHPREIVLMDRALDQIKQEHKIPTFILVGHSPGGQIVAGLLNRRSDVSAAVISSGLVSVSRYQPIGSGGDGFRANCSTTRHLTIRPMKSTGSRPLIGRTYTYSPTRKIGPYRFSVSCFMSDACASQALNRTTSMFRQQTVSAIYLPITGVQATCQNAKRNRGLGAQGVKLGS